MNKLDQLSQILGAVTFTACILTIALPMGVQAGDKPVKGSVNAMATLDNEPMFKKVNWLLKKPGAKTVKKTEFSFNEDLTPGNWLAQLECPSHEIREREFTVKADSTTKIVVACDPLPAKKKAVK